MLRSLTQLCDDAFIQLHQVLQPINLVFYPGQVFSSWLFFKLPSHNKSILTSFCLGTFASCFTSVSHSALLLCLTDLFYSFQNNLLSFASGIDSWCCFPSISLKKMPSIWQEKFILFKTFATSIIPCF